MYKMYMGLRPHVKIGLDIETQISMPLMEVAKRVYAEARTAASPRTIKDAG